MFPTGPAGTDTTLTKPACQLGRFLEGEACQLAVCDAARHPHEIIKIFLETVGIGQHVGRRFMHGTQVARMPRIATTHVARGRLDDQNRASGLGRRYGGAKPGIAGADHKNVPKPRKVDCRSMYTYVCRYVMTDMEVKTTDSIDWAELARQIALTDGMPSAAPARLRQIFLAAIQSGALAPGARLKEVELVNALSVSRTPLREALAALRAEGILERDDDGLRVRRLGWRDVRSLYELRGTLEAMAAQLAAQNATRPERQVIGSICEAEAALIDDGALPKCWHAITGSFTTPSCRRQGNRFLSESLERLSRLMVLLGATAYSLPDRITAIRTEHEPSTPRSSKVTPKRRRTPCARILKPRCTARLELLSLTASTELD